MTDNGLGWHTRGHGGSRGPWGHQGAPRGFRGVWGNPGAKKSDKTAKQWLQTMVWSTQSVSWPKRGGSYSFLSHLGPVGCIKIAILSQKRQFVTLFGAGRTPDLPEAQWCPPGPPGAPMTLSMSSKTIVSHPGSWWVIFDPSGVNNPRHAGGGVSRQTHHPLIHIRFRNIRMRFF